MARWEDDYKLVFQSDLPDEVAEGLAESPWFKVRLALATSPHVRAKVAAKLLRDPAEEIALATFRNPCTSLAALEDFLLDARARNHAYIADHLWEELDDVRSQQTFWDVLSMMGIDVPVGEYRTDVTPTFFWTEDSPFPFRWSRGVYGDHHFDPPAA